MPTPYIEFGFVLLSFCLTENVITICLANPFNYRRLFINFPAQPNTHEKSPSSRWYSSAAWLNVRVRRRCKFPLNISNYSYHLNKSVLTLSSALVAVVPFTFSERRSNSSHSLWAISRVYIFFRLLRWGRKTLLCVAIVVKSVQFVDLVDWKLNSFDIKCCSAKKFVETFGT